MRFSIFLILFSTSVGAETRIRGAQQPTSKCIEAFLKISLKTQDPASVAQARVDLWNQWTTLRNVQNETNREGLFKGIIEKIENLWDMDGTKWELTSDERSLIISPDPKGSYLNRMAASMETNLGGTRLVLDPGEILSRGGGYSRPSNSIFMPIEALSHPQEGIAMVAHEVKHRIFWLKLNEGHRSFLYGWFNSNEAGSDLEELFTYALELRIYSSILRGADHIPGEEELGNIAAKRTGVLSQWGHDKIAKPIKTLTERWLPTLRSIQSENLSVWNLTQWTEKIDGYDVQVRGLKDPNGHIIAFHQAPLPFNSDAQRADDKLAIHVGFYSNAIFFDYSGLTTRTKVSFKRSRTWIPVLLETTYDLIKAT
ncbi:MAG: hypothetical protein NDJ89_14800 [Oligoflexia bacterium]|nr:hypothetical protein [Oligoflexia bacterium]